MWRWVALLAGAVVAVIVYRDYAESTSSDSGDSPGTTIPSLVAPVITGPPSAASSACVSKTDAQGNWYGLDISGNCTRNAIGGAGGMW